MSSLRIPDFFESKAKKLRPAETVAPARNDNHAELPDEPQEHDGLDGAGTEKSMNPEQLDPGQTTLSFIPKRRKRTLEEIYRLIPTDHPRWLDTQCFAECTCWFCEINEGLVTD